MSWLGIDIGGSSVKAALRLPCASTWVGQSTRYQSPDLEQLTCAMADAVGQCIEHASESQQLAIERVGLCLPGVYDAQRSCISRAIHLPAVEGVHLPSLLAHVCARVGVAVDQPANPRVSIITDAYAAAIACVHERRLIGRTCCLSLGTGVGASVVDVDHPGAWPKPLLVSGHTPGHIGQLDVGSAAWDDLSKPSPPQRLESFIGLHALERCGAVEALKVLHAQDGSGPDMTQADLPEELREPIAALVRAIRICHAIYRPNHVVLAGGVGVSLQPLAALIHSLTERHLTLLARTGWTLSCATDGFYAARGAAQQAAQDAQQTDQ